MLSQGAGAGAAGSAPAPGEEGSGGEGSGAREAQRLVNDTIDRTVAEEFEKRRFPEVAAHYRKCAQKLASRIDSLQKTNSRLTKAKEDFEILRKKQSSHGL